MASYLIDKYKCKYQLKAEIDQHTGDFSRDKNGNLDNYSDIWIACDSKGKVFHYGKNVLQFYCPSLGRGHNILKAIYDNTISSSDKFISIKTNIKEDGTESENKSFDYDSMYSELNSNGIIFDIEETDEEVLFKFKATNFDTIVNNIKPKTFCADRSPFSSKNIPRSEEAKNYEIPVEDLNEYKEITSQISISDISLYRKINNGFLTVLSKKKRIAEDTLKLEIKTKGWKFKEFIHSQGDAIWDSYMKYIKNYLAEVR